MSECKHGLPVKFGCPQCEIESLRAEVERLRQAIERHKECIPFKEPDYEDYQLWKALEGEEVSDE